MLGLICDSKIAIIIRSGVNIVTGIEGRIGIPLTSDVVRHSSGSDKENALKCREQYLDINVQILICFNKSVYLY